MPMLYPPKPSRSQAREPAPQTVEDRRAERRRRERLYEIEFFRGASVDADDLLEPPSEPRDPRLARALAAAGDAWVVMKYRC